MYICDSPDDRTGFDSSITDDSLSLLVDTDTVSIDWTPVVNAVAMDSVVSDVSRTLAGPQVSDILPNAVYE